MIVNDATCISQNIDIVLNAHVAFYGAPTMEMRSKPPKFLDQRSMIKMISPCFLKWEIRGWFLCPVMFHITQLNRGCNLQQVFVSVM